MTCILLWVQLFGITFCILLWVDNPCRLLDHSFGSSSIPLALVQRWCHVVSPTTPHRHFLWCSPILYFNMYPAGITILGQHRDWKRPAETFALKMRALTTLLRRTLLLLLYLLNRPYTRLWPSRPQAWGMIPLDGTWLSGQSLGYRQHTDIRLKDWGGKNSKNLRTVSVGCVENCTVFQVQIRSLSSSSLNHRGESVWQ